MNEDDAIEVTFTAEQLALIETAARGTGCTVAEYILREALMRAGEMIASAENSSGPCAAG